ncbi:MAG TPA: HepT-like ribonuclease domain-containing protein [Stellaceae bacterium]
MAYDRFVADLRTVYAVTRCLEIISEALRRLPDDLKARHPQIPWRDIAGAGNVYRHDERMCRQRSSGGRYRDRWTLS